MDINVRIRITLTRLVAWLAWVAGTALVILSTLNLADADALGVLVAMFGTAAWSRGWFCSLKQRELVAFDHGRQYERAVGPEVVVPMNSHR